MPLPKPLKKSAPKKKKKAVLTETFHKLKHDPVTSPARKATSGEQRKKQNVAIALKTAGMDKKRRSPKRKRPRNKGRS